MRALFPLTLAAALLLSCAPRGGARDALPGPGAIRPPAPPPLDLSRAWTAEQIAPIKEKTRRVHLAPDLSQLSPAEAAAVSKLREVGEELQALYEDQNHPQAAAARAALARASGPGADDLRLLYRIFSGPIATTLDNRRAAFLPVEPTRPGKAVYPWGVTRQELDTFLSGHPDARAEIVAPRTVVRRADPASVAADLATLDRHPVLDTLHPALRRRLLAVREGFYAVPYSVAYADRLLRVQRLLFEAADLVAPDDPAFAGYLKNRGRDLLADDYESGDAAWVTASFVHLNAEIGSYETYDDELFGAKTFFACSLLVRRTEESQALSAALAGLQAFEDALPYAHHKKVRERIPVGVYDVIADYGQARSPNTATILPNEAYLAQRYGRTILLRGNILREPGRISERDRVWEAVVAPAHAGDPTPDGDFYRTLWHEIGHYLGVDTTADGRDLHVALEDAADLLEEMKADLVSLFVAEALHAKRYYDDVQLRGVYAAGIQRVVQNNRPRRDQPYATMQLIQWNFFLDKGLLRFDAATGRLVIDYPRYHATVEALLGQVLEIQRRGDKAAAEAFITRYTSWDDGLHGVIARHIREAQRSRYQVFTYGAEREPALRAD